MNKQEIIEGDFVMFEDKNITKYGTVKSITGDKAKIVIENFTIDPPIIETDYDKLILIRGGVKRYNNELE